MGILAFIIKYSDFIKFFAINYDQLMVLKTLVITEFIEISCCHWTLFCSKLATELNHLSHVGHIT